LDSAVNSKCPIARSPMARKENAKRGNLLSGNRRKHCWRVVGGGGVQSSTGRHGGVRDCQASRGPVGFSAGPSHTPRREEKTTASGWSLGKDWGEVIWERRGTSLAQNDRQSAHTLQDRVMFTHPGSLAETCRREQCQEDLCHL